MKVFCLFVLFVLGSALAQEPSVSPTPTSTPATPTPTPKNPPFDEELCEEIEETAAELIELELSGVRWQGGQSKCLDQSKFTHVLAKKVIYGDAEMLDPKVILQKGKTVKIDPPVKNGVTDVYTVRFYYVGKKKGAFVNIKDQIQFSIYNKTAAKTVGCALLLEEPATFVMREECHHD